MGIDGERQDRASRHPISRVLLAALPGFVLGTIIYLEGIRSIVR